MHCRTLLSSAPGSIPGWEAKILYDLWSENQNIKQKQRCDEFNWGQEEKGVAEDEMAGWHQHYEYFGLTVDWETRLDSYGSRYREIFWYSKELIPVVESEQEIFI